MSTLLLDPDIRDWVVLPLFAIMVLAGIIRHYLGILLANEKKRVPDLWQRSQNLMKQTSKIRSPGAHYMTTWKWHVRKNHYAERLEAGAVYAEEEEETRKTKKAEDGSGDDKELDPMEMMMGGANPLSMMKGNMAFMVQNMVMMQGINHFFSGFILLKIPFPLTAGFKSMFQRGLQDMPDLEPSYVSSISWYFLCMYGLRSLYRLLIGDPSLELREQDMLLAQLGLQNPPPNPNLKQDVETAAKQLRQEAENLELLLQHHKSEMDSVEKRLLGKKRYPKRKNALGARGAGGDNAGDAGDFLLGVGSRSKKSKSHKQNKKTQ